MIHAGIYVEQHRHISGDIREALRVVHVKSNWMLFLSVTALHLSLHIDSLQLGFGGSDDKRGDDDDNDDAIVHYLESGPDLS